MGYSFTAQWLKGALNNASDALSCNPVTDPSPQDLLAETEFDNTSAPSPAKIRAITTTVPETTRIQNLKQMAEVDPVYQKLKHYIISGFPIHRQQLPDECKRF